MFIMDPMKTCENNNESPLKKIWESQIVLNKGNFHEIALHLRGLPH